MNKNDIHFVVVGSNGRIGSLLCAAAEKEGIAVTRITRKVLAGSNGHMEDMSGSLEGMVDLESIDCMENANYKGGVLYNCAWRRQEGEESLMSGDLISQFSNLCFPQSIMKAAKMLKCNRIINLGSIMESYVQLAVEEQIPEELTDEVKRISSYGLAKLAVSQALQLLSYIDKIEFANVRFSACISETLDTRGYIEASLRVIRSGLPYELPKSQLYHDVIFIEDLCRALIKIGVSDRLTKDYFVGSSQVIRLYELFDAVSTGQEPVKMGIAGKIAHAFDTSVFEERTNMNLSDTFTRIVSLTKK